MKYSFALLVSICAIQFSWADLNVRPKGQLSKLNYIRIPTPAQSPTPNIKPFPAGKLLPWPVRFQDNNHTMGNTMAQFQKYDSGAPYWHGGCDLRASAQSEIYAPVSGTLDAGHYGYEAQNNGHLQKFWKAWPQQGSNMYFELAVITDDGYRYEFHHVNRSTLPSQIVDRLNRGPRRVSAGELIGRVIEWPVQGPDGSLYHHIHYNIIDPNGVQINPEYVSEALSDRIPPEIFGVYGVLTNEKIIEVNQGQNLNDLGLKELIIATTDTAEHNVYVHPPTVVQLTAKDSQKVGWDFSQKLLTSDQQKPDIRLVFKDFLETPSGKYLETQGNYQDNFFLFRLPVTTLGPGPHLLQVRDQSGNQQTISFGP